ncbi:hypothetical protein [Actinomadura verrucosospora]|uniref:Uncharacterized protein n=1 Tax=Actinomadura verrucosospora TaxID=46165 RepID=A0A7D3ZGL4_ACTVE|nr:hypothetical protein [Actinomadura verrucosospora]QKG23097.1 hypothetical protein ACTIVE_4738 [Actinomadura verrucosospora]
MAEHKRDEDKPLADRRAEAGAPQETDEDFAEEHTPSKTDPPNAEAEAPGGEDEGYRPHTQAP